LCELQPDMKVGSDAIERTDTRSESRTRELPVETRVSGTMNQTVPLKVVMDRI
jgi:hypothetical protein